MNFHDFSSFVANVKMAYNVEIELSNKKKLTIAKCIGFLLLTLVY